MTFLPTKQWFGNTLPKAIEQGFSTGGKILPILGVNLIMLKL